MTGTAASPTRSAPARSGPTRLRARTVLSLVAGRGLYRIAYHGGNLSLLAVWGEHRFAFYAAALGSTTWLVHLGAAVEKGTLKLLPRVRALYHELTRLALLYSAIPLALSLAALAPVAVFAPGSRAVLYLLGAVWSTSTGLLFVVAALNRLEGRPNRDSRSFLILGIGIGVSLLLTRMYDLSPATQLVFVNGCVLVLIAVTCRGLRGIRRPTTPVRHRRTVVRSFLRTIWLLGVYDLASAIVLALTYVLLGLSGRADESAVFYVGMLSSGVAGGVLLYLLRIAQPRTSARLQGAGAASGRGQARRLLTASWSVGAALAVVLAVAAAAGFAPDKDTLLPFAAVIAVEVVLYTLLTLATFLVENTDSRALSITSGSAWSGLVVGTLLAAALVPLWGPFGAAAALGLGAAAQSAILSVGLHRGYGRPPARRSERATAAT